MKAPPLKLSFFGLCFLGLGFFGLGSAALSASASYGDSNVSTAAPLKNISVCLTRIPMYSPIKPSRRQNGLMVIVINQIAANLKLKPNYQYLSPGRCRSGLKSGKFDLYPYGRKLTAVGRKAASINNKENKGLPDNKATSRKNEQARGKPKSRPKDQAGPSGVLQAETSILYHLPGFVVRANSPLRQYDNIGQFHNAAVGNFRGANDFPSIPDSIFINRHQTNSLWALDKMLLAGRIDAITGDYLTFLSQEKNRVQHLRFLLPPFTAQKKYFLFNQHQSALKIQVEQQLISLLKNGFIDRVYRDNTGLSFTQVKVMAQRILRQNQKQDGTALFHLIN